MPKFMLLLRKLGTISPMPTFFLIVSYIYVPYLFLYSFPRLSFPMEKPNTLNPENESADNIAFFLVLHIFIVSFLISYYRTFATDPGGVPDYWHAMILEELNRFDHEIQGKYLLKPKNSSKSMDLRLDENPDAFIERNALSDTSKNKDADNDGIDENRLDTLDEMRLSELEDEFLKKRGFERFCPHCQNFKPPRAHHCRECGRCVLKMDHHCPWVLNCIGFYNYKLFYNMLVFGDMSVLMITLSFLSLIGDKVEDGSSGVLELTYISSVFACMLMLSVLLTLFLLFHTVMLVRGRSTIENCDKKKKKRDYDQGLYHNVTAVLGANPFLWFIPVRVNYIQDGVSFTEKIQEAN